MENIFWHLPLSSLPKLTGFGIPFGCTEEILPSIPHPNLSLVNKGANERLSFFKRTNHSAVKIGSTVVFPGYLLVWGSPELLEAVSEMLGAVGTRLAHKYPQLMAHQRPVSQRGGKGPGWMKPQSQNLNNKVEFCALWPVLSPLPFPSFSVWEECCKEGIYPMECQISARLYLLKNAGSCNSVTKES